nr:hypothetical protein [Tanacetum cinerariifolium]
RVEVVEWLKARIEKGEEVMGQVGTDGRNDKGIVLTGGNQDTTLRMITVLKHLKRLGVKLPIECFHYEGELTDSNQRNEIEKLGAKIKQVVGVSKQDGVWKVSKQ